MRTVIRVADMAISNNSEETLITYSLGSCIAVVIYDPLAKVGGMLHFMLPDSSIDPEKARSKPAMFADTGIPMLLRESYRLGANNISLIISVVGGSQIYDENGHFNIGNRNYLASRKILSRNNILIHREHVGGSTNRTVHLQMGTGKVFVKISGIGEMELV